MAWDDIAADPEYQGLDTSEKDRVRTEYFDERIAPKVPQQDLAAARESFLNDTAPQQQGFDFGGAMSEPAKMLGRANEGVKSASMTMARPVAAPIDAGIARADKAMTPNIDPQALPAIGEAAGLATGALVDKAADMMGLGGSMKRASKDVASGGMGTVSGFAGLSRAMGMENFGQLATKAADATSRELLPPDPVLADEIAAGMGSMAAFMVPGVGLEVGAGKIAMVAPRLAQFMGVTTASVLEAGVEGGSAYNRVMDKTGNKDAALVAGNQAFWANVPLVYLTNKLGWAGEQSSRAVRALESVLTEGTQEASQELVGIWAAKDPLVLGQIFKAAIIGGATGGLAGAAMHSTMQPEGPGEPVRLVTAAEREGGATPGPASSSSPAAGAEGAPAQDGGAVPPPVPPSAQQSESQPPAPGAAPSAPDAERQGTPASSPYFESIRAEAQKNKWGYGTQPAVDRGIHPEILTEMEGLIQATDPRTVKSDLNEVGGVYERARWKLQSEAETQLERDVEKIPENVTPAQAKHLVASMERAIRRWHISTGSESIPAEVLSTIERLKAVAKPEKASAAPAPGTPPKGKKGKKAAPPAEDAAPEDGEADEADEEKATSFSGVHMKLAQEKYPITPDGETVTLKKNGKDVTGRVIGHGGNDMGFSVILNVNGKKVILDSENDLGIAPSAEALKALEDRDLRYQENLKALDKRNAEIASRPKVDRPALPLPPFESAEDYPTRPAYVEDVDAQEYKALIKKAPAEVKKHYSRASPDQDRTLQALLDYADKEIKSAGADKKAALESYRAEVLKAFEARPAGKGQPLGPEEISVSEQIDTVQRAIESIGDDDKPMSLDAAWERYIVPYVRDQATLDELGGYFHDDSGREDHEAKLAPSAMRGILQGYLDAVNPAAAGDYAVDGPEWWNEIKERHAADSKEAAVLRAISSVSDAPLRWQILAEEGASNQQIKDALSSELGDTGGSSGPGLAPIAYKGKNNPSIWIGEVIAKGKPTFTGTKLVAKVRELLGIPQPKLLPSPATSLAGDLPGVTEPRSVPAGPLDVNADQPSPEAQAVHAKKAEAEGYRSQAELAGKAASESEEAIQKLKAVSPEPTAVVEEKIKGYEQQVIEYQKQAQDLLEKASQAEAQASVLRDANAVPEAPVAPLLRKSGKKSGGGGGGFASKGAFAHDTPVELGGIDSIRPVRMPEMVKLATDLMGQVPTLKKFPRASGMFYGRGGGEIKLNPEIFKDPTEAAKTLAHEIGHLIDYLPDHTLKRGNLLGSLHTLRQFLKASFGGDLFTGQQGHSVTNKDIRDELLAVTRYWRPWDEKTAPASYNSYRKSARELYADSLSMMFNSPGTLEKMAPKFYKAFFEHLDQKPAVKLAFFQVQEFLHKPEGEIRASRHEDIRMMFAKGEAIWAQKRAEQEVRENRLWEDFCRRVGDKFYPILKKVAALESQGVAVPNSENPKYLLEELSLSDAANHAMLARIDREVKAVLDKSEVDLQDAGAYMMLTRIAAGDRQTFANPKGYSPEEATKQLEFLAAKLGTQRHADMLRAIEKLHDLIFEVNLEAVAVGAYNQELFTEKIVPNRKTYASFAVLKYLDDYVPAAIKSQVGTLEDIANPFTTTIMKAMSTNRLIALQKAKNSFKDIWLEHFPSEIQKAKPINPQDHIRQYRKEPGMGQFTVLEDGKPVAYNVDPFIADAFEKRPAGEMSVALRLLQSVNNGVFRPLYVTFNLGFSVVSNPIRDFKRTYKNLPAASLKTILVEYARALPVAYRREAGIHDEIINEMIASKALDIPFNDFNLDPEKDQLGAILAKMGLLDGVETNTWMDKAARYKVLKPFIQVLEGIRFVGSTIETMPKVAGYQILKKDALAKLDQAISQTQDETQKAALIKQRAAAAAGQGEYAHELAYQVRNYIGTPNFRRGGIDTKTTNTIFMFSNIMKEGMKSDYQVATNPKTRGGYMLRTTLVDLMPKLLMLLAAAGAGGDELEEFFGKVSEYDKTNYTIIPMGWSEKADGSGRKAVYLRIPHDEGGRLAAGVFWKLAGAIKGDLRQWQQVLDFGAGQLPGFAPPITIAYQWEQFLTGKNPNDAFRGRPIISDTEFKAGGYPALKKMVQWTVNQFGVTSFSSHDSSNQTITEQALQVAPLLNRLLKVSDYGVQEQERAAIAADQSEKAQIRLERGQAAKDFTKERYILIQKQQADILTSSDRVRLMKLNKYMPAYKAYTKSIEHSIKKGDVEEAERLRQKLDAMLERLGD